MLGKRKRTIPNKHQRNLLLYEDGRGNWAFKYEDVEDATNGEENHIVNQEEGANRREEQEEGEPTSKRRKSKPIKAISHEVLPPPNKSGETAVTNNEAESSEESTPETGQIKHVDVVIDETRETTGEVQSSTSTSAHQNGIPPALSKAWEDQTKAGAIVAGKRKTKHVSESEQATGAADASRKKTVKDDKKTSREARQASVCDDEAASMGLGVRRSEGAMDVDDDVDDGVQKLDHVQNEAGLKRVHNTLSLAKGNLEGKRTEAKDSSTSIDGIYHDEKEIIIKKEMKDSNERSLPLQLLSSSSVSNEKTVNETNNITDFNLKVKHGPNLHDSIDIDEEKADFDKKLESSSSSSSSSDEEEIALVAKSKNGDSTDNIIAQRVKPETRVEATKVAKEKVDFDDKSSSSSSSTDEDEKEVESETEDEESDVDDIVVEKEMHEQHLKDSMTVSGKAADMAGEDGAGFNAVKENEDLAEVNVEKENSEGHGNNLIIIETTNADSADKDEVELESREESKFDTIGLSQSKDIFFPDDGTENEDDESRGGIGQDKKVTQSTGDHKNETEKDTSETTEVKPQTSNEDRMKAFHDNPSREKSGIKAASKDGDENQMMTRHLHRAAVAVKRRWARL